MTEAATAKPALVLVHGWCANQTMWKAQFEHLKKDHEVLTFDLGGHGQSPAVGDDWSILRFANDVIAFLEEKNLKNVILVGHSMGGAVCAEASSLRPDIITAVILADTFLFDYGFFSEEDIQETLEGLRTNMAESVKALVYQVSAETASNELKDFIVSSLVKTPKEIAVASFDSLLRWNMEALLPFMQAPIYAINGDKISPVASRRYKEAITDFHMEGAGHFLHLEDPAKFNKILDQVLVEIDRQAGKASLHA